MAEVVQTFSLLLILLFSNTGFRADDTVFVKTGASVQLDIPTHEVSKIKALHWEKDSSTHIVTYVFRTLSKDSSYRDRVDFNVKNFSLTLRNMQKTDNGTYRARSLQEETYEYVAEYRVSVMDEVEAPKLTDISNQSSSDSCTVNFTCKGHDLTLSSTYNNGGCSPEEVTSPENYTLILICTEESIICNHSNPVSWKTDTTDINQLCVNYKKNLEHVQTQSNHGIDLVLPVLGTIGLMVAVLFLVYKIKKIANKGDERGGKTVYDQVKLQKINSDSHTYADVPNQEQEVMEASRTTYCTVGQHQMPLPDAPMPDPITTDHTIYSQVYKQQPKKPDTTSSKP